MIDYSKLFALLKIRNMKKTDLLKIISSPTLAKLSKGQNISTDTIDKICIHLGVQPSDIMEVYEEEIIDGKKLKIKTRYGEPKTYRENEIRNLIVSELEKFIKKEGNREILDEEKIDETLRKINE
jgi:putative transcriptional regulator